MKSHTLMLEKIRVGVPWKINKFCLLKKEKSYLVLSGFPKSSSGRVYFSWNLKSLLLFLKQSLLETLKRLYYARKKNIIDIVLAFSRLSQKRKLQQLCWSFFLPRICNEIPTWDLFSKKKKAKQKFCFKKTMNLFLL